MLKKIISLILAVSMLLSMAVVNVNAEEVSAGRATNFENAVTLLKKLGAISNENFTFESEITKAQFVSMLSKIVPVSGGAAEPVFADVPATHTSFKVIQGFAESGYINGYAGSFEPDRAITYNEALYIMLNAMGYGDFLDLYAKYPVGGWDFAKKLDIKMNNKGAIAGDILYMVYQALNANMFAIDSIDKGNLKFSNEDAGTMLYKFCEVEYATGILKSNGKISIDVRYEAEDEKIVVGNDEYEIEEVCTILPGYEVDVFFTEGTDEAICVLPTAKNEVITINSEDIVRYVDGKYTYSEDGKTKSLKISSGTDIVLNNVLAVEGCDDANAMQPVNGTVIAVKGGSGSEVDVLYVNEYQSFVITSATRENEIGTLYWKELVPAEEDGDDPTVETVSASFNLERNPAAMFDAEGNAITFDDIEIGDVVSVLIADGVINEIVVSDATVTGDLTKIGEDEPYSFVVIDGQTYNIAVSAEFILETLVPQSGATLYLDFMGNVVGFDSAVSSGMAYGYILGAKTTENEEYQTCIKVKLLSEIGSVVEYLVDADRLRVNGSSLGKNYDVEAAFNTYFCDATTHEVVKQLIRYDVNDEREISKIDFPDEIDGTEVNSTADDRLYKAYTPASSDTYAYNYSSKKILGTNGKVHYDTNTLIFKIPNENLIEDAFDEDYQVIRDVAKLKNGGRYDIREVYVLGEDSICASVIVISDCITMYSDSNYYIVKDVKTATDEYDETIYTITVDGVTGEKTFTTKTARVAEEAHNPGDPGASLRASFSKLVPGDVIRCQLDADGVYVIDIELVYSVAFDDDGDDDDEDGDGKYTIGAIASASNTGDAGTFRRGYVYALDDTYVGITEGVPTNEYLSLNDYEPYKISDFKIFKMSVVKGRKAEEISPASAKDLKAYKSSANECSQVLYYGYRGAGTIMIILD